MIPPGVKIAERVPYFRLSCDTYNAGDHIEMDFLRLLDKIGVMRLMPDSNHKEYIKLYL